MRSKPDILERSVGCMKIKRSKNYYLKELQKGNIDAGYVAKLLNTAEETVNEAVVEFSKKRSPFRQRDFKLVVEISIAVISMLLVWFTLREMQIERNNAYKPDIFFNETMLILTWDSEGAVVDINEVEVWDYYKENAEFVNTVPRVEFENIGMGTAKYLRLQWDQTKNMKTLTDYLYTIKNDADFTYEIDKSYLRTKSNGLEMQSSSKAQIEIAYMKNESEKQRIMLPFEYFDCLRHICYNYRDGGMFVPGIDIISTYQDIQGKEYKNTKTLQFKLETLTFNPEGSGWAVFTIREIKSK